jgi:hypothetical protein
VRWLLTMSRSHGGPVGWPRPARHGVPEALASRLRVQCLARLGEEPRVVEVLPGNASLAAMAFQDLLDDRAGTARVHQSGASKCADGAGSDLI